MADNEIIEIFEMIEKEHKEIKQYREIGTIEEFKALKEKAEPKIIEQLKERVKEINKDLANIKEESHTIRLAKKEFLTGMKLAYENAIEIIRKGGVE